MKFTFAQAREAVKEFANGTGNPPLNAALLNETTKDLVKWAEEHRVRTLDGFKQMMQNLHDDGLRIEKERNCKQHVRAPLDAQCIHCGAKMALHDDETYNCFGTIVKR